MPTLSDLELTVSQALTAKQIIEAVERSQSEHPISFKLSKRLRESKSALVERLFHEGGYWQSRLLEMAQQEGVQRDSRAEARRSQATKRKRKSRRSAHAHEEQDREVDEGVPPDSEFFKPVSWPDNLSRLKAFYDATTTDALRKQVCAVCARWLNTRATKMTSMLLGEVPNLHRLKPSVVHPAMELIDGYLLERAGCTETETGWMVNICKECHRELKKKNVSTPPKFSLANGLWVGKVPKELSCLTIAEQLLIARVYPRVFVMKLYPKSTARHGLDDEQLQGALRGNVTSFELNSDAIGDMIAGNLMPQLPAVLASVLSVTFIGRGKLPDAAALRLFQVRRNKVAAALDWLHDNNPKYYGDIVIDKSRLDLLPEDGGVPREILVNMHREMDDSVLNAETDGYVPGHDDEGAALGDATRAHPPGTEGSDESEADVIPLQYLGVMDNDMTKISTSDIIASGLLNLQSHGDEGGYAVRHGGPVNTFGQPPAGAPPPDPNRPNYWEQAFPLVHPFGVGGIECDRPVTLSFIEHVRWALQYYDRRFRLHPTFIFVAFAIYQRRQVLVSARIQMRRRDFGAIARTLSTITPQDLQAAAEEEDSGRRPSNPSITVLKRYINATSSRVMGSDAARYQLRSQIWSTSVALNPPTLWMTINPDDLHDPIAQVFAGEEINMDNFAEVAGPDKNQRSRNIARDPFAAAEFFNFLVTTILEELLGIRTTRDRVYSTGGVLGKIKAYFGVVECQGRGTLHLHMLAWLEGAPTPDRLKELLRTEEFKSRVVAYLQANVRAFHPSLATQAHLQFVPPDPEIAYSRFPDPSTPEPAFQQALEDLETKVIRTKQMHSCTFGQCLKPTKNGLVKCKRRAPFDLSESNSVDDDGTYRIKRTLAYLNSYCPAITVTAKCNNDIKLLLHGAGTNNITFYVTGYIAKKQGKSYNVSGLLAKHLAHHFNSDDYIENLQERQRILLLRAVNVLNREQEVPAPLAVSLLMGWGDVYRSHRYAPVYWTSFVGEIYDNFPNLRHSRQVSEEQPAREAAPGGAENTSTSQRENEDENQEEAVVLNFDRHGRLHFRSQVEDYTHRGTLLENYNVYDFLVGTYDQKGQPPKPKGNEEPIGERSEESEGEGGGEGASDNEDDGTPKTRPRGRPRHDRVAYQPDHSCHESHVRVMRHQKHNTLPNFIGPRLPSRADPDQAEFYAASILTMLKPWRKLTELKQVDQSWASALEAFLATCEPRIRDIVASFEHYYECKAASEAQKKVLTVNDDDGDDENNGTYEDEDMEPPEENQGPVALTEDQITPEMIAKARIEAANEKNPGYGQEAVDIGRLKGVFTAPFTPIKSTIARGTHVDVERLADWQKVLERALQVTESAGMTNDPNEDAGGVVRIEDMRSANVAAADPAGMVVGLLTQHALDPAAVGDLFPEQLRAFNIVRGHLALTLEAIRTGTPLPPQLLMLLVGEGGTGKSKVIQTITAEFERRGVVGMLIKAAYTGIAASLIQGKTTHNIGCISVGKNTLSDNAKAKLAKIWKDVRYLIIDEYSMLSKEFLGQLSRHIQIGRMAHDPLAATADFGGVNVVICGDGHQFPPVRGGASAALFHEDPVDRPEVKLGLDIFRRFTTVVRLRQQVRVTDEKWRTFLTSLRQGQVEPDQVAMVKSLVLTNPSCEPLDFQRDPWQNVSLVTPRHVVRNRWNEAAVTRHCQKEGRQLFICPANDTIKKRPLTKKEQLVAAYANPGDKPGGLPDSVMLAVGMKVMVTLNVETDLDIANGARGEVVDIVLNPDEPPFDPKAAVVTLQHLPLYVLVKLARHTRAIQLPGLEAGVVPIVPASKGFRITMGLQKGRRVVQSQRTVRRLQFPLTPAYAFTDYRSQGQTIDSVIVDITTPPTGGRLTLFNIYVALSRSSGTKTIRILRDFNEGLLMQPLNDDLAAEDRRLDRLDAETLNWYNGIDWMF